MCANTINKLTFADNASRMALSDDTSFGALTLGRTLLVFVLFKHVESSLNHTSPPTTDGPSESLFSETSLSSSSSLSDSSDTSGVNTVSPLHGIVTNGLRYTSPWYEGISILYGACNIGEHTGVTVSVNRPGAKVFFLFGSPSIGTGGTMFFSLTTGLSSNDGS